MSQTSIAAAVTLQTRITELGTQISSLDARVSTLQGGLTVGQRNAITAEWTALCLEMKSLQPLIMLARAFGDAVTALEQRGTVWLGLRAYRLQVQKRRQAIVDYALQCNNEDQIYSTLNIPLSATEAQIIAAIEDAATAYVHSTTNEEVALELLTRKIGG